MSTTVAVNYAELLKRIDGILCKKCRARVRDLDVPLVQSMKVESLIRSAAGPRTPTEPKGPEGERQ